MKRAKKQLCCAPRNPLVVAVKFRKAGAHGKTAKALRRDDKMKTVKMAVVEVEPA